MADTLVDPFADAEIIDPFADAIVTPKVERPFTSAEYYEPDLMGDIPTDSRIYQQLMTTPEFRDADANEKKRLYRKAVDDANFETYRQQGEPVELVESLGGEMRTQTIQTEVISQRPESGSIHTRPKTRKSGWRMMAVGWHGSRFVTPCARTPPGPWLNWLRMTWKSAYFPVIAKRQLNA